MSLVTTQKIAEPSLSITLHPVALLTISDYITRHTLRKKELPIVGALLGQQNGRTVSVEQAFECLLMSNEGGHVVLQEAWFRDRLQQYKDVHKSPALDLVGWFTLTPSTGPEACHVPIHQQILDGFNETAVLLAFHPSRTLQTHGADGQIPVTIYESLYEVKEEERGDVAMKETERPLELRFRELPYTIEAGEAEMIGVDFVARGGGGAAAISTDGASTTNKQTLDTADDATKEGGSVNSSLQMDQVLSSNDEESLTALHARINAVKMFQERLLILKTYLASIPPCHLTATEDEDSVTSNTELNTKLDHQLLRSIRSLITRLPLLLPSGNFSGLASDTLAEKSDAELASLLAQIGQSIFDTRALSRKFATIEAGKSHARRANPDLLATGGLDPGYDDGERMMVGLSNH